MDTVVIATPGMYNYLIRAILEKFYREEPVRFVEVPKGTKVTDALRYARQNDEAVFLGLKYWEGEKEQVLEALERRTERVYIQTYEEIRDTIGEVQGTLNYTSKRILEDVSPVVTFADTYFTNFFRDDERDNWVLPKIARDIIAASEESREPFKGTLEYDRARRTYDKLKLVTDVLGANLGLYPTFYESETLKDFLTDTGVMLIIDSERSKRDRQIKEVLDKSNTFYIGDVLVVVTYSDYRHKEIADKIIEYGTEQGFDKIAVLAHRFTKGDDMYYVFTKGLSSRDVAQAFGGKPWGTDDFSTAFGGNTRDIISKAVFTALEKHLNKSK